MQIHYDESEEYLLKKVLDNPDIHIGLDAAIGKDRMCKYCLDKLNLYMRKIEGKLGFKRLWRRSDENTMLTMR